MKTISKLSLLAIALTLASCNEKVSPELQGGNSTVDPGTTTPIPPDEYYFAVVNSSDTRLNYKLHKTGLGNASKNCEVRNTTGFSNDAFRGNPAANDITCYFDAEELSLENAGLNLKVQASKNSCDFVGYSPFGYYNRIPGDSSGTYLQVDCGDQTTAAHVATEAAARAINISTSGANVTCGEYVSQVIAPVSRIKFTPTADEDLCRFNYKDGDEEKCDIGTVTVNKLTVTYTPSDDGNPATGTLSSTVTSREIKCGGKIHHCVKGPTKELKDNSTSVIEVTQTGLNVDYSKEYKYAGVESNTRSTIHLSNYRRNLTNPNIDYVSSIDFSYDSIWSDPIFGKTFDPKIMDYYSANLMQDGMTRLVTVPALDAESIRSNIYTARPLAADPFMGLGELMGHRGGYVNPFYTFYCFDTAYDMKARVRIVVRDWDRIFPGNADLEYLSDLFRGANGRQDNPYDVELPGDIDYNNGFNDLDDWDDMIPMERTIGNFDPFSTVWRPIPTVAYPNGWFRPGLFPQYQKDDDN